MSDAIRQYDRASPAPQSTRVIFTQIAGCVTFFLFVATSGCTITPRGIENIAALAPNHKIAIVSLLGDDCSIETVGTTVFQNWQRDQDVAAWNIDEVVQQLVADRISAGGRFIVQAVDTTSIRLSAEDAASREGKPFRSLGSRFWLREVAESLKELANQSGANSVILVTSMDWTDPFFGTNQVFEGYGIAQRSVFGMRRGVTYASISIDVVDGTTGESIAGMNPVESTERAENLWIGEDDEFTQLNQEQTRIEIEMVLKEAIEYVLTNLTLIGTLSTVPVEASRLSPRTHESPPAIRLVSARHRERREDVIASPSF